MRVVYGAADPEAESGAGGEALRAAGVEVQGPVWADRIGRAENPAFFHTSRHDTPFLALKLAMTLDARIAAGPGVRTQITGVATEREVHRLRTGFDAVMIGAGTARVDDPRLTPRLVAPGRTMPRRIVLLPDGELPEAASLFQDIEAAPLHLFVRADASPDAIDELARRGAQVHPVSSNPAGLDLDAVLGVSWKLGIRSVLCEGGARLAGTLLREKRVHRLYLFIAPTTLGAVGLAAFPDDAGGLAWKAFEQAFKPVSHGRDTLIVLDRQEM